jgi:mitogen-activated protein kinase 15
VEDALNHPYLKDFKGTESEPCLQTLITIPLNENKKLTINEYREAIYSGNIIKKTTTMRAVSVGSKAATEDEAAHKQPNYSSESHTKTSSIVSQQ